MNLDLSVLDIKTIFIVIVRNECAKDNIDPSRTGIVPISALSCQSAIKKIKLK